MTRLLRIVVGLSLCFGSAGTAFADCPNGQKLKRIGTVQTADAAISSQGRDIHLIIVDCGGTACTAGLYDGDATGDATNANLTIELGGVADTSPVLDLTNSPVTFSNGIVFVDDANVDAVAVFGCTSNPG